MRLKPDLVWWSEIAPYRFVGDAKYKRITSTDFPNADIYQMLAYCYVGRPALGPAYLRQG